MKGEVPAGDVDTFTPSSRTLRLQLSTDAANPLLCAEIDAVRFRDSRRSLRFTNKRETVVAARGLRTVRLRLRRGQIRLKAIGRRVPFLLEAPADLRVLVGFLDVTQPGALPTCRVAVVPLEATRKGGLKLAPQ